MVTVNILPSGVAFDGANIWVAGFGTDSVTARGDRIASKKDTHWTVS